MRELIIKSITECFFCGDAAKVDNVEFAEDTLEITYICDCGNETKDEIVVTFA